MDENNNNQVVPGKGAATASMVLGIIAVVLWFFGVTAIGSVVLGIIGLILAAGLDGAVARHTVARAGVDRVGTLARVVRAQLGVADERAVTHGRRLLSRC